MQWNQDHRIEVAFFVFCTSHCCSGTVGELLVQLLIFYFFANLSAQTQFSVTHSSAPVCQFKVGNLLRNFNSFNFYPSPTGQKYLQEQFPVLQMISSIQNSQSRFTQDGNIVKETPRLILSLKCKLIFLFRIRLVLCSAECMYVSPKVPMNGNEFL